MCRDTAFFKDIAMVYTLFFILCLQKMKSGELKELHELNFVGRIRYAHSKENRGLLETAVRHDRHSLQSTNLPLDLLIADDFLKTSEGGETRPGYSKILGTTGNKVC